MVLVCGFPSNVSRQFPSMDKGHQSLEKNGYFGCVRLPPLCWKCPFIGLCMYTTYRFCKKVFNLLFSCYVCNYVHTNLVKCPTVFSLIAWKVNVGTGPQLQNVSLQRHKPLLR